MILNIKINLNKIQLQVKLVPLIHLLQHRRGLVGRACTFQTKPNVNRGSNPAGCKYKRQYRGRTYENLRELVQGYRLVGFVELNRMCSLGLWEPSSLDGLTKLFSCLSTSYFLLKFNRRSQKIIIG